MTSGRNNMMPFKLFHFNWQSVGYGMRNSHKYNLIGLKAQYSILSAANAKDESPSSQHPIPAGQCNGNLSIFIQTVL